MSKQELITEITTSLSLTDTTTITLMGMADKLRFMADRIDAHLAEHTPVITEDQRAEAKQLAFDFVKDNAEAAHA